MWGVTRSAIGFRCEGFYNKHNFFYANNMSERTLRIGGKKKNVKTTFFIHKIQVEHACGRAGPQKGKKYICAFNKNVLLWSKALHFPTFRTILEMIGFVIFFTFSNTRDERTYATIDDDDDTLVARNTPRIKVFLKIFFITLKFFSFGKFFSFLPFVRSGERHVQMPGHVVRSEIFF